MGENKKGGLRHMETREGGYASAFEQSRKKLRQLAPETISQSALIPYDHDEKYFLVNSLGRRIQITYPEGKVSLKDFPGKRIPLSWELILLNYLSSAQEQNLLKEWVSYRDLPHGNVFYPNIKNNVLDPLGRFFAECEKGLLIKVLHELGFAQVQTKADLAARADFVPRVPVLIQFWEGEEGIPSTCRILYDKTIAGQVHIEDAAALAILIKDLILKHYKEKVIN